MESLLELTRWVLPGSPVRLIHFVSSPRTVALLLCLALVICLITWCHWGPLWRTRNKRLPPGSFGWPLIGETISFIIDGKLFSSERLQRHGPVFKTHILGVPMVIVSGAAQVRRVLQVEEGAPLKNSLPRSAELLMGRGALCTSEGPEHRARHRQLLAMFGQRDLKRYTPLVRGVVSDTISQWCEKSDVQGVTECRLLSFHLANTVLFGLDLSADDNTYMMQLFEKVSGAFFSFPVNLPGFAFHKGLKAHAAVLSFIEERRLLGVTADKPSLLQHLLATEKQRSSDGDSDDKLKSHNRSGDKNVSAAVSFSNAPTDVKNALLEMLFGSHETLASTFCAVLICLHQHPHVLEKIREELKQHGVAPHCGDTAGNKGQNEERPRAEFTFELLTSLQYVNDVMNEVLRHMPPIAGAFRQTTRDMKIMDYDIPAGWTVLYHIGTTHQMSPVFDHVNDFNPDRWAALRDQEPLTGADRIHYMPFGWGQRACPGKEFAKLVVRTFIVELAMNVRWKLLNGVPKMKTSPIPFPADGLPTKFES